MFQSPPTTTGRRLRANEPRCAPNASRNRFFSANFSTSLSDEVAVGAAAPLGR
ncbi:Uncharacterised protein [Mycobacteroides abscessus subsp. abscessus]|nr:Uncharacterised protein [Mycobacteroides abscessus subsp. abscessus]